MKMKHAVLLAFALVTVCACDATDPANFESQVVVESYQVAGEPLKHVRLARTAPTDVAYDIEESAVNGATVVIERLDAEGDVVASFPYFESSAAGVYFPRSAPRVEPLTKYRLHVHLPQQTQPITATTLVPDTFRLVEASADTLVYGREPLTLQITPGAYPGRQSVYTFTSTARDSLTRDRLTTPFFGSEDDLEDIRRLSSPVLNEANYETLPSGAIVIEVPWLAVLFYGPNEVQISTLDDNLYDFLRSYSAQAQGSTLRPGEIPNILEHVEGGIGVFASFARVRHRFYVKKEHATAQ